MNETIADEYDYDSSDEEDMRNTIGNIPLSWYANKAHIGYDTEGRQILKPQRPDELDSFLRKLEDPDFWRTVQDPSTGQEVKLNAEDLDLVRRIVRGRATRATAESILEEEWSDWFSSQVRDTPLSAAPPSKAAFIPSRSERLKVGRMVHAIKMGWMPSRTAEQRAATQRRFSPDGAPPEEEDAEERVALEAERTPYDLWEAEPDERDNGKLLRNHIRPPRKPAPGHAESYNPAPEFLFNEDEEAAWHAAEEGERRLDFVPRKYPNLRRVPAYPEYTRELQERCQDLYLAPRLTRQRVEMTSEQLLPPLPPLEELRPYPDTCVAVLRGHVGAVLCLEVSPCGQLLASGGEDGSLRVWQVGGGVIAPLHQWQLSDAPVLALSWRPPTAERAELVLAAGHGSVLHLVSVEGIPLPAPDADGAAPGTDRTRSGCTWRDAALPDGRAAIEVQLPGAVRTLAWQRRGDFLASAHGAPAAPHQRVLVHRVSHRQSQAPLAPGAPGVAAAAGLEPVAVAFHPGKPWLAVADQRNVTCYDLAAQQRVAQLTTGCRALSSLALHPSGDHLLAGAFDGRAVWFDLELSRAAPYKSLSGAGAAVRHVALHPRLPLCALAADDASVGVYHARVYADLLRNPLLLPVKTLRGHARGADGRGVCAVAFHPTDATLFSGGADGTVRLVQSSC